MDSACHGVDAHGPRPPDDAQQDSSEEDEQDTDMPFYPHAHQRQRSDELEALHHPRLTRLLPLPEVVPFADPVAPMLELFCRKHSISLIVQRSIYWIIASGMDPGDFVQTFRGLSMTPRQSAGAVKAILNDFRSYFGLEEGKL